MKENSRRGFMGKLLGGFAGLGAIGSLVAMKKTWDPLPSVKAAGFITLDMSVYADNELVTEEWRKKPIFIMKKSAEAVKEQTEEQSARDVVIDGNSYMVAVGLCTHLGCIPAYKAENEEFLCACHGATFDSSGLVTKLPAPRGLDIPPFKIDGSNIILGEVGPEWQKMKDNGITL